MSGLLPLLVRRAAGQARLLGAVLVVLVAGATLLGTCSLLLTGVQDRARHVALDRAPLGDRTAQLQLLDVTEDPAGTVQRAGRLLDDALGPLAGSTSTWAETGMRDLPPDAAGGRRVGYLAALDDLARHARLADGRWPAAATGSGPPEAVVPVTTAAALGLHLGDQLPLLPAGSGDGPALTVVVVGTFTPVLDEAGSWDRDLLAGAGSVPSYDLDSYGGARPPAYGPFAVAPATLLAGGLPLLTVDLRATPDLGAATTAQLFAVRARLDDARTGADTVLGPDAGAPGGPSALLTSTIGDTVDRVVRQQAVTRSGVLTVALVGAALAGTALGLAGRLVAGRRGPESLLLTARGAGRRRLVGLALTESLLLGAVGAALALPLSLGACWTLGRVPLLRRAGLGGGVGPDAALGVTVVVTALLLALLLALPGLRPPRTARAPRRRRRGAVLRSGADLLLAALAVVAWLQLRGHPAVAPSGVDPVLVAAPVLALLAGAALALRALPLASAAAERYAGRSRTLVGPLAAWDVARRPHATGAAFLLVLATAAATFGLSAAGTWSGSQAEQAAARVGADLTVPAPGHALLGQGAAVAGATAGRISPAAVDPVAVGSVIRLNAGSADAAVPQLLAVDTASAGALLRGRVPGDTSWAALTRGLAPAPAAGLSIPAAPAGLAVTVTGTSGDGVLSVRPTLLVADPTGSRLALTAADVPLDGAPHTVLLRDATGAVAAPRTPLRAVGAGLAVDLADRTGIELDGSRVARFAVAVRIDGATAGVPVPTWSAAPRGTEGAGVPPLSGTRSTLSAADGAVTVAVQGDADLSQLLYEEAALLALPGPPRTFTSADPVPVVISRDLAEAADAGPGAQLPVTVHGIELPTRVVRVVPLVPSLPGRPALLADYTAVADALAAAGDPAVLTTAWWVGGVRDPAGATARLAAAGLPGAQTRAGVTVALRDGPLRLPLRIALALLVGGGVLVAVAGAALHAAAAQEVRLVEVARLSGLGVRRRAVAGVLLLQHGVVAAVSVLLGLAVGALSAVLLAPPLALTDTGTRPVPVALLRWPWPGECLAVLALLAGCLAVAVPATLSLVRRADAGHLRLDDGA